MAAKNARVTRFVLDMASLRSGGLCLILHLIFLLWIKAFGPPFFFFKFQSRVIERPSPRRLRVDNFVSGGVCGLPRRLFPPRPCRTDELQGDAGAPRPRGSRTGNHEHFYLQEKATGASRFPATSGHFSSRPPGRNNTPQEPPPRRVPSAGWCKKGRTPWGQSSQQKSRAMGLQKTYLVIFPVSIDLPFFCSFIPALTLLL